MSPWPAKGMFRLRQEVAQVERYKVGKSTKYNQHELAPRGTCAGTPLGYGHDLANLRKLTRTQVIRSAGYAMSSLRKVLAYVEKTEGR
jgi:hypothetical protein